jgi:hypothetical protein
MKKHIELETVSRILHIHKAKYIRRNVEHDTVSRFQFDEAFLVLIVMLY